MPQQTGQNLNIPVYSVYCIQTKNWKDQSKCHRYSIRLLSVSARYPIRYLYIPTLEPTNSTKTISITWISEWNRSQRLNTSVLPEHAASHSQAACLHFHSNMLVCPTIYPAVLYIFDGRCIISLCHCHHWKLSWQTSQCETAMTTVQIIMLESESLWPLTYNAKRVS